MQESWDGSGSVTAQFFRNGQTINGSSYFYTVDHLGSVRELTNSAGLIVTQYKYDPFGRSTSSQVGAASDMQYAGYYCHARSQLNTTLHRAYSSVLGRWINRDPIGLSGGINLYRYGINRPTCLRDPSGLAAILSNPISGDQPPEEPLLPTPPGSGGGVVGGGGGQDPPPPGYGPPSKPDWSTWNSPEMWDLKYKFWCALYAAAVANRTYGEAIAAGASPEVAGFLATLAWYFAFKDCVDKPYDCRKLPPPPKPDDGSGSENSPPQLPGPQK